MKNTEILLRTYRCTGCGACLEACRRGVLQLVDNGSHRFVQAPDAARCAGCRACERSCPHGAIAIRRLERSAPTWKRLVAGLLPLVLALACTLPRSLEPEAWQAIDGWKIIALFALFHVLLSHVRIPKILKKIDK